MADFMNGDDTKMKQTAQNIEKKIDEAVIMLQVLKLHSVLAYCGSFTLVYFSQIFHSHTLNYQI